MVLDIPTVFGERPFKDSPEENQVETNQGSRIVSDANIAGLVEVSVNSPEEVTHNTGTYTTKKQTIFTPTSANHQILFLVVNFEGKTSDGGVAAAFRLNEAGLGISDVTSTNSTSYVPLTIIMPLDANFSPLSSYTLKFQLAIGSSRIASAKNVKITITLLDNTITTTDSSKYGAWT